MSSYHTFKTELNWILNPNDKAVSLSRISRNHEVSIAGKKSLKVSAAKTFRGDASLHNPEDLLLSALTSCHMMSYLYVCAQHQIKVLAYTDNSEAQLEVEASGKGSFKRVNLNPVVTIKKMQNLKLAEELHAKANELCFIANSCNFPIHHNATILVD